jgi:hypothetical protein
LTLVSLETEAKYAKISTFLNSSSSKIELLQTSFFLQEKIADASLSDPSALFLTSALYYNDTPTSAFFTWSSNISLNASAWPNVNITRPVVDKCLAIATSGIFQASCEKPTQFICERPRRCELIFLFNSDFPYLKEK